MTSEVKPERTFSRDLRYSVWHRQQLPSYCYCTDLDWIEWRSGKGIVAFIETKLHTDRMTDFQIKVFTELEELTGIPAYLVRYNEDLSWFQVMRIRDNFVIAEFSELEYIEWLSGLGG